MDKNLKTHLHCGAFLNHTCLATPPTPQTMLDASIQNFSLVSTLYRVGEGELQDVGYTVL